MCIKICLDYFQKPNLLILLSLLFISPYLHSKSPIGHQKLYFRQIIDGLSQSNVRAIAEDSRGYLWIGTDGGLNRFDGLNFRVFEMDEADTTSMPDNRINDLLIDAQERLWIATYHAVALYVEKHEHFITFNKETKEDEEEYLDALSLFEDSQHQIWVGTLHGVYVVDKGSKILQRPSIEGIAELNSRNIISIAEVGSEIWFGTDQGVYVYEEKESGKKLVRRLLPRAKFGEIQDIFNDSYGRVWLASKSKGLFRLSKELDAQWEYHSYYGALNSTLKDHCIFKIFEDSQHRIWIGTESLGLNLYIPSQDGFVAYTKDTAEELALKTNSIWEIFEDASGRLFFGSNNQGMFVHDPFALHFNHLDHQYGLRLKFSTVSAFLEVGKDIWLGTDGGGISIWDRVSNTYSFFNHDPAKPSSLGSNEVLSLFQDSQGDIWVGNWNGGLNKYDPVSHTFRTYKHNASARSIGSNNVFAIDEAKNGDLWMSTWGQGVSRYNRSTDDFYNIGYIPYDDDHLSNDMTYDIEIDNLTGDIWVATVLGVDRIQMLDVEHYHITHFRHDPADKSSLSAVNVNAIFEDKHNRLWIGTANGLNLFDRKSETFQRFHVQDGLAGNVIKEIIQDNDHAFWITTSKGLNKMTETVDGFNFELYTQSDGLQANEFFINSSIKTAAGEIFVGGVNGFNHFDPDEFTQSPFPPKIQFTNLKLFNKAVEIGGKNALLPSHINTVEQITLTKDQSAFSIDYHGIGITSPEKHQYAYKLEGFDQNWNYVGNQKTATYTNLDPGDYVFHVSGANRDGVWNTNPRSIKIKILPPWWQTWWARLILIVSPLAFIVCLILIRFSFVKSQKKQLAHQVILQTSKLIKQKNEIEVQAQQLLKVNQQKDKLFSIISHDLRSPIYSLQGITNMLDPEILNATDLDTIKSDISHKIENIGNVMVNLLDWSKSQMAGESLQIEDFDIAQISDEICKLYQPVACEKNVKLVNSITEPLLIRADKNQVRVIFRNLIGNALKFTHPKDMIYVGCEVLPDHTLSIKVSDTGIGMKKEQVNNLFQIETNKSSVGTAGEKGVGLGLLLVKEFVEKNGGSIGVNSKLGFGTTFRFSLPLAK